MNNPRIDSPSGNSNIRKTPGANPNTATTTELGGQKRNIQQQPKSKNELSATSSRSQGVTGGHGKRQQVIQTASEEPTARKTLTPSPKKPTKRTQAEPNWADKFAAWGDDVQKNVLDPAFANIGKAAGITVRETNKTFKSIRKQIQAGATHLMNQLDGLANTVRSKLFGPRDGETLENCRNRLDDLQNGMKKKDAVKKPIEQIANAAQKINTDSAEDVPVEHISMAKGSFPATIKELFEHNESPKASGPEESVSMSLEELDQSLDNLGKTDPSDTAKVKEAVKDVGEKATVVIEKLDESILEDIKTATEVTEKALADLTISQNAPMESTIPPAPPLPTSNSIPKAPPPPANSRTPAAKLPNAQAFLRSIENFKGVLKPLAESKPKGEVTVDQKVPTDILAEKTPVDPMAALRAGLAKRNISLSGGKVKQAPKRGGVVDTPQLTPAKPAAQSKATAPAVKEEVVQSQKAVVQNPKDNPPPPPPPPLNAAPKTRSPSSASQSPVNQNIATGETILDQIKRKKEGKKIDVESIEAKLKERRDIQQQERIKKDNPLANNEKNDAARKAEKRIADIEAQNKQAEGNDDDGWDD